MNIVQANALVSCPAPKVLMRCQPFSFTSGLYVPFNTSTSTLMPSCWPLRTTALRAFCASTVPSKYFGGSLHTSQLPQGSARSSLK